MWAVDRCIGPRKTLHSRVPSGFARYVRLYQPGWYWQAVSRTKQESWGVDDVENRKRSTPVRWRDIAEQNGKTVHRLMQWWSIAPPSIDVRSGNSGFSAPYDGELTLEMVETLFDILIRHSGEEQECICAFWEGFGIFDRFPASIRVEGIGQQGHILFNASLAAVRDQWCLVLQHAREPSGLTPQAVWPISCDWYYAVPFEMYSSYFGGAARIVAEILSEPSLETDKALPGDNLWQDEINTDG